MHRRGAHDCGFCALSACLLVKLVPRSQTSKVGHAVNLTQSPDGVGFMQQSAVELLWKDDRAIMIWGPPGGMQ